MMDVSKLESGDVLQELLALVKEAGEDERRVLLYIARRIVLLGQRRSYGNIDIKNDKRDMLKEVNQELADAIFYVTVASLKRELTTFQ